MKYTLRYFASLADQAGCAEEICETTLSEPRALYAELSLRHGFTLDASRLRIAINGEFAGWQRVLVDGDEIVFFAAGVGRMKQFLLCAEALDPQLLAQELCSDRTGAFVSFEGRVRNHNIGRAVQQLEYQAYAALAEAEGARILLEAAEKFTIEHACCAHRVGTLAIGDIAVWVGVSAAHRDAAFACCRYIIDEVKLRVPIWKNEHYTDGESGWLHPDNTPVGAG